MFLSSLYKLRHHNLNSETRKYLFTEKKKQTNKISGPDLLFWSQAWESSRDIHARPNAKRFKMRIIRMFLNSMKKHTLFILTVLLFHLQKSNFSYYFLKISFSLLKILKKMCHLPDHMMMMVYSFLPVLLFFKLLWLSLVNKSLPLPYPSLC